jgi:hypothetical protein
VVLVEHRPREIDERAPSSFEFGVGDVDGVEVTVGSGRAADVDGAAVGPWDGQTDPWVT